MIIDELTECVRDNMVRLGKNEFTGTVRFEVHCNSGTARRMVVIEEPQKLEYITYQKENKKTS
jgi:hypothetical protein